MNQFISKPSKIVFIAMLAHVSMSRADLLVDSSTMLNLRNAYIDRDYKQTGAPISRAGGWTQGADLQFKSGYTQGPINFGFDISAQYAVRLDGGGGRGPDSVIPYSHTQTRQATDYGHAAPTLKMKMSNTEFRLGELRPLLPVAYIDDSRQLITTFQGWQIESKDIQRLSLTLGKYSSIVGRNSSNRENIGLSAPSSEPSDKGLLFAGGTYTFTPWISGTYFYGQLEDIYQQHYAGLALNNQIGNGFTLKTDLRYYNSHEIGKALNGVIDNQAYGVMTSLKKNGHSFGFGYQRMLGDTAFPLLNGYAASPYLVNWSPTGFAKAQEASWQVRYDFDFFSLGLPGLKFMTRFIKGSNIVQTNTSQEGSEWEATTSIGYVIQSGTFKDVAFEWRHIDQKVDFSTGRLAPQHYDENRLITTYTLRF